MSLRVSVVVPTCGRRELLERCLDALERQSLERGRYEVIVIEDRERRGPAWARNQGWRRSRAPVVAFTDDDCVPAPDWLLRGLKPFDDERADVVCGRIVMPLPEHPTDYERDAQRLERAEFVTANCLCRKAMLERQNQGIRELIAEAERGSLVPRDRFLIGIDEAIVGDLFRTQLPLERPLGKHFRVHLDSATVSLRDKFGAITIEGYVYRPRRPDRRTAVRVLAEKP